MKRIWGSRILIGLVLFFNIQCAIIFLVTPAAFAPMYELGGLSGQFAVQGIGLLFIMWNIPYVFALINPRKYFVSLIEAVLMQAVGVIGETLLFINLPANHLLLQSSMLRFIWFDAGGLLALLVGFWLTWQSRTK
jgi:hypothetical protein